MTEYADDDMFSVSCPYKADWVEDMKIAVPYEARDPHQGLGWDKGDRVWRFHIDYEETIEDLCSKHFRGEKIKWNYEVL